MNNTTNFSYIGRKNVINLGSEVLFREAEDDFFYFNKINSALKKLEKAIVLTPNHSKSLLLSADIYFMKGNIKKAFEFYKIAYESGVQTPKCLASIANCYYSFKEFDNAIAWADLAIKKLGKEDYSLYSQIIEIKINSLVEMKMYKQAYVAFIQAQNIIDSVSLKNIYSSNYELINEKLKLQKKLRQSNLKIV